MDQKQNIVLFDVELLNIALDSISSKKCFDQCTYEHVKKYVSDVEILRESIKTLNQLQEMIKSHQESLSKEE
jgi:hypothetical protein